ncbi:polysaccharide biosynthesis/export family protein [Leptolyngbya ohadii]|uniref:polysaccharide biosynthesis/export family protein n=1 Tax=Leptolyngbya ohadii TaxID=1962290 RepID=UPI0015C5938C|nr:polysaccharide biosynthesis/export family protein [Leptolyngbya ohadii]
MLRQFTTCSIAALVWATQANVFYQAALASPDNQPNARSLEASNAEAPDRSAQPLQVDRAPSRSLPEPEGFWGIGDRSQPSNLTPDEFDSYRLGAGDSLFVTVFRFPDLNFQNSVDPAGNILVPLVGALPVAGLTLAEAKTRIQTALDRYVIEPQIDVILTGQRPVSVTIVGEVVRPGFYPLQAPQLTTALITAGGTTGRADLRSIRVQRQMPDGSLRDREIDLYTPFSQAQTLPDLRLSDGDTIVIPNLTDGSGYDRELMARSTLSQQQIRIRVMNYAAGNGGGMGTMTLPSGSRFLDAITAMPLDLNSADIRKIALVRFDEQQQKAVSQELDGKKAMLGDSAQDPMLENNDVIVIGRTWVARITYALNTFTQPFRDVLGFLLFFQSLGNSAANLFSPNGRSN